MIFFVHNPKTGGSTFRQMLRARYPDFRSFGFTEPAVAAQKLRGRALPQAAGGHVRYGIHRHLDASVRYATILRDPVDRLASYYHYMRYLRKRPDPLAAHAELEDWIGRIAAQKPHILNEQWKMIGRSTHPLTQFKWVGVTERFDSFCRAFFGDDIPDVAPQNVFQGDGPTDWRATLPTRAIHRIEDLNARDMRLYETARRWAP